MADPIIEIANVHKNFGSFQALADIDLTIHDGEIISLLGPSGCGKSTLMRMIAGFEAPSGGHMRIAGRAVDGLPPERRPVNMVFQRYALFPHLDVFENIAFGLRVKGVAKDAVQRRVQRMVRIVQLEPYVNRFIGELSGGQCQRVALARALINEPKVLLLDEPLAALDLKIRQHMLVELKRIHGETGATFLYVTHDQDEALLLSDRIVLMERGRIVQVDTPQTMYRRPNSLFSAKFLGETNLIQAKVAESGPDGALATTEDGMTFRSKNGTAIAAGKPVTVSLRPEMICIRPAGDGAGGDAVSGTVRSSLFQGSRIFLQVDVGHARSLRVQCLSTFDHLTPGTRVVLDWRPEDVVFLAPS